jgi:hypothetical protein
VILERVVKNKKPAGANLNMRKQAGRRVSMRRCLLRMFWLYSQLLFVVRCSPSTSLRVAMQCQARNELFHFFAKRLMLPVTAGSKFENSREVCKAGRMLSC